MVRRLAKAFAPFACLCFLCAAVAGCSQNDAGEAEKKGSVEKLTDRAATEAVTRIRTPLDKAREAANSGEERAEEMDRAVRSQ